VIVDKKTGHPFHVWLIMVVSCAVCLLAAGLVSSVPAKRIQQFAVFSAIALVFGGVIIMILLPLCAPKLQTATWVFSSFFAWEKEEQGIPSDA